MHCHTAWGQWAVELLHTALRQCGSALQELHCPLPLSSVAVHDRASTAHCPQAVRQTPCPPGSVAVHCRNSTAHCPRAVWQCIAGVPLFRQPPPPGRDSPSPQLVGPRIARVPLPTAPGWCGSALQELHWPLPLGSGAVRYMSCTAHCP